MNTRIINLSQFHRDLWCIFGVPQKKKDANFSFGCHVWDVDALIFVACESSCSGMQVSPKAVTSLIVDSSISLLLRWDKKNPPVDQF